MEGTGEAAADILTGGVIARAVEPATGEEVGKQGLGVCRNCSAALSGAYCAQCGQVAHFHRSLVSLGHDILHGVFHFEGKVWHTLPELFFHPGRLTRRYIGGERAKFVSPMALYLVTVFLMFAVFAFTGGALLDTSPIANTPSSRDWKTNMEAQIEEVDAKIEAMQEKLEADDFPAAARDQTLRAIADLRATRDAMRAMIDGDWRKMMELDNGRREPKADKPSARRGTTVDIGWPALENRLNPVIKQSTDNPALLLYKLKSTGYKFSWALIPLSLPFMWIMFFWRRDLKVYDHAIFVSYSISFMMLLTILVSVAVAVGVNSAIWGTALGIVPPLHLYKQLRGAYGLSRWGTLLRLSLLLMMIVVVLALFLALLITLGVLT